MKGVFYLFANTSIKKLSKIYKKQRYENIPYITKENAEWILEHLKDGFPILVVKEYMQSIKVRGKKVLRGHIILLWWLNNPRTKKETFPLYFEREYGIDAKKALNQLKKYGWADEKNKLTEEGKEILLEHDYMVKQHRAIKMIQSDGTVEYNYTRILKGEEKRAESMKWHLKSLNSQIKNAEECNTLLEWSPVNDDKTCSKCRELAERDNGYGKGIYTPEQAKEVLKEIHWDCRCTWLPVVDSYNE